MRTLYLHVGTPKTGTTALQHYLRDNREFLRQRSVIIPNSTRVNNEEFSLMVRDRDDQSLRAYLKQFAAIAPEGKFVLSCELLYSMPLHYWWIDYARGDRSTQDYDAGSYITEKRDYLLYLQRILQPHFDEIKIVVVLRRQDRFLNSAYIEGVQFCVSMAKEEYARLFAFECDYLANVNLFAEVFGKQAVLVESYESAMSSGGVQAAFSKLLGVELNEAYSSQRSVNVSLTEDLYHFRRRFNRALDKFYFPRAGVLFDIHAYTERLLMRAERTPGTKLCVFSREQSAQLLRDHAEGNRRVAMEFLQRDTLFDDAPPAECTLQREDISADEYTDFLTCILLMHMVREKVSKEAPLRRFASMVPRGLKHTALVTRLKQWVRR